MADSMWADELKLKTNEYFLFSRRVLSQLFSKCDYTLDVFQQHCAWSLIKKTIWSQQTLINFNQI